MKTKFTRRHAGYRFADVFRFALKYWMTQPYRFALFLLLFTVSTFIQTNLPNILSAFFESVRAHSSEQKIWQSLMMFLIANASFMGTNQINFRMFQVFENNIYKKLLDDAFAHVESLSEQYFVNTFAGSMITTIKRGRDRFEKFQSHLLIFVFPACLVVINSIVLLAFRMPMLAAILSAYIIIFVAISVMLILKYAGPAQEAFANAQDRFGAHLADCITGIVTTKSYAQEERENLRFQDMTTILRNYNLVAYHRSNTVTIMQRMLQTGMLAILLGGGTWYFVHGRASISDMAYLVMAHMVLNQYISGVGDHVRDLLTSSYDLHAIITLFDEKPAVTDKPGAAELLVREGEVRFHDVTFTYPGKTEPVLQSFSINIRPGERIALVGDSGGGKTTFVRLVQRLYDVDSGSVTIDGQAITEVTQSSLRHAIAVVPQDPILFHRSIRDNIAYGRPDASLEEIRQAAKQASIDEFIMSLPQAYETLVGERGIKLSGGERQRVAIARAILSDRKILILDEATSSLDSASELAVQNAIRSVTHGRTSIMIAHRLSTIRDADRILVFRDGKIVEEGTHADLTGKRDGIYASLVELQSTSLAG
jgi:ATP-binding cassette subfamily B protein